MIHATKARQAASHPDWAGAHVPGTADGKIQPALVTPATTAMKGAVPHLGRVGLWRLEEFQNWADVALDTVREICREFVKPGDLDWRANAAALLERAGADTPTLYECLSVHPAGSTSRRRPDRNRAAEGMVRQTMALRVPLDGYQNVSLDNFSIIRPIQTQLDGPKPLKCG